MPDEQPVVKHNTPLPARESFADNIAAILLRRNMLDINTLQKARTGAQADGKRLEEFLVDRKIVSDTDMTMVLAEYLAIPPMTLAHFIPENQLLELIPQAVCNKLMAIPIAKIGKMLTVAVGDPFNISALDEIQTMTGLNVVPVVATEREVKEVLQKFAEKAAPGLEDMFKNMMESEDVEVGHEKQDEASLDQMLESAEGAPVIRIVNSIMVEAMRRLASDIHIEPMEKTLRLRYRIDGDLYEVPSPSKNMQSAIISRLKIMSGMDIAERRIPQDGRFNIKALGREVDVRVSLLPLIHGEKIVMRILDKSNLAPSLAALGLDPKAYESLIYAISQPHGIILVTGPTGSGKTTTLYSCLQDLNKPDVNIMTTEDPVEYQLAGITQVQIDEDVGLTFSLALRAIVRQDPDIVMVGEIRDQETAAIAVKAALTGQLVLSTLHTNDAAGAITRLRDMGIEAFLLASSLIMAQAQRLYKKLCPVCRRPRALPLEYLRLNHLDPKSFEGAQLFEPAGCPKCGNTGFKGRNSLMEILMVDDNIRKLILQDASATELAEKAVANGMMTLKMVGLEKVKEGISSLEEILSVTGGE
ncbi:MAG: Flp pilus assembly complex ATPase component TadA [Verrucomicrobia bacterium]|nr:Flp pilus assembly complex ATPase component TadA [Verrucomicrobiota bacterium]MBU1734318.1 Flp pilus assembly complex ATPase component TadA [Verrucomicrobiota bacterium]MBU1857039.1 Flp pilus assembly complex ATPase component TadA [Verrucomicrobiota bacterium]